MPANPVNGTNFEWQEKAVTQAHTGSFTSVGIQYAWKGL